MQLSPLASCVYFLLSAPESAVTDLRVENALDVLTARHTAFASFREMLTAAGNYRPSFYLRGRSAVGRDEIQCLANLYDAAQAFRGDPRRAYRGDFGSIFSPAA